MYVLLTLRDLCTTRLAVTALPLIICEKFTVIQM
jgi:hypothetical protein